MTLHPSHSWRSSIEVLEKTDIHIISLPEDSVLQEKRKYPRYSFQAPLQFRMTDIPSEWQSSQSLDLTKVGLRITMDKLTPYGTRVEIDIALPGTNENIYLQGIVAWSKESITHPSRFETGITLQKVGGMSLEKRLLPYISDKLYQLAIDPNQEGLSVKTVESFEELKSVFHLIYQEYHKRGYCGLNKTEMHYSFYSTLPKTRTFLLHHEQTLLGTISLICDSPCGIPMDSHFLKDIDKLRNADRRIAEVSMLALNHEGFPSNNFSLTHFRKLSGTFTLFKHLFDYAKGYENITDLVIAVHPHHEDLYHYLFFENMGTSKEYTLANGKPALPMRLNLNKFFSHMKSFKGILEYFAHYPTCHFIERKVLRWSNEMLNELLIEKSGIWQDLPTIYQKYIQTSYPHFTPKDTS